jgi:hypothetical protein
MNRSRSYSHIHTSLPPNGPYPEPDDYSVINQAVKEDSAWTAWPVKMGPTGGPETSVTINQLTLRNIPEEPRPQTRCSESLKCHRFQFPTSQPIISRPILILSFHSRLVFFPTARYSYQHCVHTPRVRLGVIMMMMIIIIIINVSNTPGNHEVKELQKTAILGTAYILRKVLM